METLIVVSVIILAIIIRQGMLRNSVPTMSFEVWMNQAEYRSYQCIDVRTKQEYQSGHLAKFKNIPLNQLESQLGKIDPTKPVALMCASGMRSAQAAKILQKHQYQVINLKGGIQAAPKDLC